MNYQILQLMGILSVMCAAVFFGSYAFMSAYWDTFWHQGTCLHE